MAESNFVDYVKSTAAPVKEVVALHICGAKNILLMGVLTVATVVEEVMLSCGETATIGHYCILNMNAMSLPNMEGMVQK